MPKPILFVHAHSRLGLLKPPFGEIDANIGVETGAEAILTTDVLKQYPDATHLSIDFTAPEQATTDQYFHTLAKDYQSGINQITQVLSPDHTLVTVGGDHSVSLTSLATIAQQKNPTMTGILMIDSHADIHQPSTSPSGNFHGMWLRPIVDRFEHNAIEYLVPYKIPAHQLMYIGNLDIEPAEKEYITTHHNPVFPKKELKTEQFWQRLDHFLTRLTHLHISIDIDAFSHQFAPATGMMILDGLSPDDVLPILAKLSTFPSLSVDLVEVNQMKEGAENTVQLAQKLLRVVLNEN